jgi:hypothetical protein
MNRRTIDHHGNSLDGNHRDRVFKESVADPHERLLNCYHTSGWIQLQEQLDEFGTDSQRFLWCGSFYKLRFVLMPQFYIILV